MISNTRKQIKLNEGILQLRAMVEKHKEIEKKLEQQENMARSKSLNNAEDQKRLEEIQEERL